MRSLGSSNLFGCQTAPADRMVILTCGRCEIPGFLPLHAYCGVFLHTFLVGDRLD